MRTAVAIAFALLMPGPLATQIPQASDGVIALTGVTVIEGTDAAPRPNMTVLVRGERIADVFRTGEKPLPAGASVRDLTGRYVMPGLIDAHVHFGPRAADNGVLTRMVRGGVTGARNMVGSCRALREMQTRAASGEIPSPDIYFSAVVAGPAMASDSRRLQAAAAGPDLPGCVNPVTGPDVDAPALVAAAKSTGATGIKIYADISVDAARKITEEAHRQGLEVWAHATVFPARPSELSRVNADVLSHAAYLVWEAVDSLPDYHGRVLQAPFTRIKPTDSAIERLLRLMAERGTVLDATLALFVIQSETLMSPNPDMGRDKGILEAAARFAAEVTRRARELGVLVSAGTDAHLSPGQALPNLHRELELLVTTAGFTPVQAIAAATSVAARTVGLEETIGRIAPGFQADLVVLRSDPSGDIRSTRDIAFVVKRGRVIVDPGRDGN